MAAQPTKYKDKIFVASLAFYLAYMMVVIFVKLILTGLS